MEHPAPAFAKTLTAALQYSLTHLDSLDRRSVAATTDLATLRARLEKPLADERVAPESVIHDLVRDVDGGILGSAGGRFFGWVIGGAVPAALAADWLAAAWDQNAALYACGPAAAVVEEVAGAWLKDIFGLPPDGHKWLNVPYDAGYAFVADAKAHRAAMSHRAVYLTHDEHARDQIDWNPDWSRRAGGFATYAALRQLGRQGLADLIDRCRAHAQSLVHRLGDLPGVEVLCAPIVNQGLVRFLDPAPAASDSDHDRWTDRLIAEIWPTGEAFFGGTTWRGRRAMRVSICNWQTSAADIDRAVSAVSSALGTPRVLER